MWQPGDLLVNFKGCNDNDGVDAQGRPLNPGFTRDCEEEMRGYFEKWTNEVERLDGKAPDVKLAPYQKKEAPKVAPQDPRGATLVMADHPVVQQ